MPKNKNVQQDAFTIYYPGIQHVPSTEIHICEPSEMERIGPDQAMVQFTAIWDTEASCSVITQTVVNRLGLVAKDKTISNTVNGPRDSLVYIVSVGLPNKVVFPFVRVIDGDIPNYIHAD